MNTLAPLTFALVLAASGCGDLRDHRPASDASGSDTLAEVDSTPQPFAITVNPVWGRDSEDGLLEAFIGVPTTIERLASLRRFRINFDIARSTGHFEIELTRPRNGDAKNYSCTIGDPDAPCFFWLYPPADPALEPGEDILVEVRSESGEIVRETVVVPELATDKPLSHLALAGLGDTDGTIWTATALVGLVALTKDGTVVHYPGVSSTRPYDPTYAGPQTELVTAIELDPDAPRAMWLGTAFTGISWFDPGPSATYKNDDRWLHIQPTDVVEPTAREIAQTTVALAPADGGVWIATLNGLYRATHDGERLALERVANGAALAVTRGDSFVWTAFTTQLKFRPDEDPAIVASWPQATSALLRIDRVSGQEVALLPNEPVVTALLADGDELWAGTPHGLLHVVDRAVVPLPAGIEIPVGLAVVSLASASSGGFWLAAYDECGREPGVLWHVLPRTGSVTDYSTRGFGERHFKSVRELPDGELLVSTLATSLSWAGPITASGCKPVDGAFATADTYLIDPAAPDALARRFGEAP